MTVAELKKVLEIFPDDMLVFVPSIESEFELCTIENVKTRTINYEHADGTTDEIEALVLDEC